MAKQKARLVSRIISRRDNPTVTWTLAVQRGNHVVESLMARLSYDEEIIEKVLPLLRELGVEITGSRDNGDGTRTVQPIDYFNRFKESDE